MIDEQQLRDLLLLHDLVDEGGLAAAAQLQQRHGGDLYGVLIDHGLVPEESLVALVGQVLRVPCVSLKDFKADPDLSRMLPAELAARWRAVPLGWDQTPDGKTQVYLAMANPLDMEALEELGDYAGGDVVPLLAGPIDIDQTLERVYGGAIYKLRNSLEAL
jgi:type IV pilus assembly protein PilB